MAWFNRKKEIREDVQSNPLDETHLTDPLLSAIVNEDQINRSKILNIPSVSACLNKIGDTVSSLEIKLYKKTDEKIVEVIGDRRVYLLNAETGDTLDGSQFKKAMITDMYLGQGGYAYVNKVGSEVRSIHYVDERNIGFLFNTDPIFKDYKITVNGISYEGWQFIKLLRNTKDGYRGTSILDESQNLLDIVYSAQNFEKTLVKTGGNKKGFIRATAKLTKEAMTALKTAFRKLYSNNNENVVILNDGLDFKESSNTSVELQLNENKETNNNDICKIFLIPPSIINGKATEEDKKLYLEGCIIPILERFAKAINSVLLTEEEKESYFFEFDTKDLLKGDVEKRFNAYKVALDSGFMQLDEVRAEEHLPAFGLDFIKLGLQDVLYYPHSNEVYTPNTNKVSKIGQSDPSDLDDINLEKGGE